MNVKLSTKLGWKSRGPAKNLGGHGPSTPPLQPPLISVVQLFMTYGPKKHRVYPDRWHSSGGLAAVRTF